MKLARHNVAAYLADALPRDRAAATMQAAAWLVTSGRRRQAPYLASDVARLLAERGYLYVRLTTARALPAESLAAVSRYIKDQTKAEQLEVQTLVDPGIIGGVRIETPTAELDTTVTGRLARFVRGVM